MKKCLITGVTGLIGSNLLRTTPRDIEVIQNPRVGIVNGEFDYVIHSAGYAQPLKFLVDEIDTIKVNTEMTMELFNRLKPSGTFLYMSSSEVYNGLPVPQNEFQIGTTDPTHPRACYIEGKRCGEAICMAYKKKGYDVKIARVSLTYGTTSKDDKRALNYFITQALDKKEIRLMDKGEAKRTYLYIDDAVKMFWNILLKGKETIYNVGGRSRTTIAELAETIAKLTNSKVIYGDKGLKGAPEDVELDIGRYEEEFGKVNFISLEEGVKKIITEYE